MSVHRDELIQNVRFGSMAANSRRNVRFGRIHGARRTLSEHEAYRCSDVGIAIRNVRPIHVLRQKICSRRASPLWMNTISKPHSYQPNASTACFEQGEKSSTNSIGRAAAKNTSWHTGNKREKSIRPLSCERGPNTYHHNNDGGGGVYACVHMCMYACV